MARAAATDQAVVELLRSNPGLTRSQIIETTGGALSTLQNRLARLERRGLVQRGESGAWMAAPTP